MVEIKIFINLDTRDSVVIVPQVLTTPVLSCGQVAYDVSVPFITRKKGLYLGVFTGVVVIGLCAWLLYLKVRTDKLTLDPPIQKAFALIPSITSYSQAVETQMQFSDRSLKITGIYAVDHSNKRFSSYSTTTLFIPGDTSGHSFTHQNISIGDTVYNRVQTSDKLLQSSIQSSPKWRNFKNTAIPVKLADIVIAGPIQDNLAILSQNGLYLTLTHKSGQVMVGSEPLLRYTFKLSDKTSGLGEGALNAIVNRIGSQGTIDVWIDPTHFEVHQLLFTNYPYISTTTISDTNTPLQILAPTSTPS